AAAGACGRATVGSCGLRRSRACGLLRALRPVDARCRCADPSEDNRPVRQAGSSATSPLAAPLRSLLALLYLLKAADTSQPDAGEGCIAARNFWPNSSSS